MTLVAEVIKNPLNTSIYQRLLGVYKKRNNARNEVLNKFNELKSQGFNPCWMDTDDGFFYDPVPNGLTFIYKFKDVKLYGDKIENNTVYNLIVDCGRNMSFNFPYRYHSLGWFTSIEFVKKSHAYRTIDNILRRTMSEKDYNKVMENSIESGVIIVDWLSISSPLMYINDVVFSD